MENKEHSAVKKSPVLSFFKFIGKTIFVIIETVVIIAALLFGLMYVIVNGPSHSARNLFVMSVRETSAIGFLADWFLTPEEIAAIENSGEEIYIETDTSLINIPSKSDSSEASEGSDNSDNGADEWGLIDEDGDGIILEEVHGGSYSGYMMVVLDPSRVILGSVPESYGVRGYTVADMCEKFDAVAGTNAGGFYDPDGGGNGSIPDSLVVYKGKQYYASSGIRKGFAGIDSNHILHVGNMTTAEIKAADIQYGVCFGPALVINGEMNSAEALYSGVNPRTAIGQRSDGAMLLLVIDGRQTISLGATMTDLAEIMLRYGAVNACNLDGGSSSLMWFNGEYVNNCASVVGIRPVPTTILVMKEGTAND